MTNFVLIFFNVLEETNISSLNKFASFFNDTEIFTLINNNSFISIDNIFNTQRKYNDISMQIFFDSNCLDNMDDFIEYLKYLTSLYHISNVFFIDDKENLKTFIAILKNNRWDLIAQYNDSQYKLIKKTYS